MGMDDIHAFQVGDRDKSEIKKSVYCDIWYIFLIPQFFETPDDGYSPSTIRSILTHHRQNPTERKVSWMRNGLYFLA
jgi:hypothetical protein